MNDIVLVTEGPEEAVLALARKRVGELTSPSTEISAARWSVTVTVSPATPAMRLKKGWSFRPG